MLQVLQTQQATVIYYGTIIQTFVLKFYEYKSCKILKRLLIIFGNIAGNKNCRNPMTKTTTGLFQLLSSECFYSSSEHVSVACNGACFY